MGKNNSNQGTNDNAPALTIVIWIVVALLVGVFTGSVLLAIIIALIGIVVGFKMAGGSDSSAEPRVVKQNSLITFRPDGTGGRTLQETEYFCSIAGVHYRYDYEDSFIGYAQFDPYNEFDSNAIAIYTLSGKLVGYIPKVEQKDYRRWTDRETLPCIGIIREGYDGKYRGKVKVIDADRSLTERHIIKFVIWMVDKYGVAFVPKEFKAHYKGCCKTQDEWLKYLDELL